MTKTKTVTEQTIHGSIEYEIVECASCESELSKADAYEFKMVDDDRGGIYHSHVQRKGYACEYCVHEGPASYPAVTIDEHLTALYKIFLADNDWGGIHPIKVFVLLAAFFSLVLGGTIIL